MNNRGQSLLEVIVALAIFALISAAMVAMATGGFVTLQQGGEQTVAEGLAQEGMEAVRAIRDRAWNELTFTTSSVSTSTGKWSFVGENTTQNFGEYLRTISVDTVCRDSNNNIATCPASYTDVETKKVISSVVWPVRDNVSNTVRQVSYLTNWDSLNWIQTDWMGGSGQTMWSDTTKYDSDNSNIDFGTAGEIKLKSQNTSTSSTYDWPFTTSSAYTYDLAKISVASGVASLVDQGGGGSCSGSPSACNTYNTSPSCTAAGCSWVVGGVGQTTNSAFTSNATGWIYADWEDGARANGIRQTSGGNPTAYIDIALRRQNPSVTASGYWTQSFVTTVANPTTGTLSFDWSIKSYNGTFLTSYIIYVFVDNFAGAPTLGTQVWSQNITGVTGWATVSNVNIASKLTTAGTYYLKLVARRVKTVGNPPNVNNTVGWDNVSLSWSKSNSCNNIPSACNTYVTSPTCTAAGCGWSSTPTYPTDNPTIVPTSSLVVPSTTQWTSFIETATKGTGEIYYQLSSDGGTTWEYWTGSAWATAGATNYNTASVVNSNITTFTTSTGQIMVKAFLSSNGSQQIILDNINIGYDATTGASAYVTSGYLVSSAFNMLDSSPVQILSWTESTSSCGVCDIQLQLRVAPDSSGSPGTWGNWYGASGVGTYYTSPSSTLLSTDLNWYQWVQYRAELTGSGTSTPILSEVKINYK